MLRELPVPGTIFLEFHLPLHFLLVLMGIVVAAFTNLATKRNQVVSILNFGHARFCW